MNQNPRPRYPPGIGNGRGGGGYMQQQNPNPNYQNRAPNYQHPQHYVQRNPVQNQHQQQQQQQQQWMMRRPAHAGTASTTDSSSNEVEKTVQSSQPVLDSRCNYQFLGLLFPSPVFWFISAISDCWTSILCLVVDGREVRSV